MADIEIRAYDKLKSRMHYFKKTDTIRFPDFKDPANNWSVPMFYIGQKDINKKKIFDGDIVKYGDAIGTVGWDNSPQGGARFYVHGIDEAAENTFDVCWKECWGALEIVGNVFENSYISEND